MQLPFFMLSGLHVQTSASTAAGQADIITGERGSPTKRHTMLFICGQKLYRGVFLQLKCSTDKMFESIYAKELITTLKSMWCLCTQQNLRAVILQPVDNKGCFVSLMSLFSLCMCLKRETMELLFDAELQLNRFCATHSGNLQKTWKAQ